MTESQWDTSNEPNEMLATIQNREVRERKLRLFAVACCRRVTHLLSDESERIVRACEALVDHAGNPTDIAAAVDAVDSIYVVAGGIFNPAEEAVLRLPLYEPGDGLPFTMADAEKVCAAASAAVGYRALGKEAPLRDRRRAAAPERAAQAALLREVLGDPFRPVVLDPSWLTSTVTALARGIYEERAFDRLPLLMDALMDAGCNEENLLNHCRAVGVHTRGCWVVDLVLGKE